MRRPTTRDQVRLARVAMSRRRRRMVARMMRARALRWFMPAAPSEELLLVPQDLRTTDPSLLAEIDAGQLGLGGSHVILDGHSPFALVPPTAAWSRELHGFGWLRDIRAAGGEHAQLLARRLVADWLERHGSSATRDGEQAVAARRIISWICHAGLILDETSPRAYEATMDSLGQQVHALATSWHDAPDGYPRLLSLTAVVLADLCIAGHDRHLERAQRAFADEIGRQILADGGHISRHPGLPVEILLDFLPLRQCYSARGREPPPALTTAIRRMVGFLRAIRLGHGGIARFNGMGRTEAAALATVIAYDDSPESAPPAMPQSHYQRLAHGPLTLVMDVGTTPPLEVAAQAHAGILSFELGIGAEPVVINCGAPGPGHGSFRTAARATASHSTLCLADRSSAHLVRSRVLEQLAGSAPVQLSGRVTARASAGADGSSVVASHAGYVREFGRIHTRRIHMAADGSAVLGEDQLGPARGTLRTRRDVPFAIRFHLSPDVECWTGEAPGSALIDVRGHGRWRVDVEGAVLSVERSLDYAHYSGPRPCHQIVLRGACPGETIVRWRIARELRAG